MDTQQTIDLKGLTFAEVQAIVDALTPPPVRDRILLLQNIQQQANEQVLKSPPDEGS